MRIITLMFLGQFSITCFATEFHCRLKARASINEPFEVVRGVYKMDRPLVLYAQSFELRFQLTGTNENKKIALQLSEGDFQSAAALGPVSQPSFYLNLIQGQHFAVADCTRAKNL